MHWLGTDCPVVAMKRRNDRGAKGVGHSAGSGSTGNRMSLTVPEGGSLREWHEPCEARVSSTVL